MEWLAPGIASTLRNIPFADYYGIPNWVVLSAPRGSPGEEAEMSELGRMMWVIAAAAIILTVSLSLIDSTLRRIADALEEARERRDSQGGSK